MPTIEQMPDGSWKIVLPAPEHTDDHPHVWQAELKEGEDGALIILATYEKERRSPLVA